MNDEQKEIDVHDAFSGYRVAHRPLQHMIDAIREHNDTKARLEAMLPLFQEARDALTALTTTQLKLHGISPTLADRMDEVGIPARWQARRAMENEVRP